MRFYTPVLRLSLGLALLLCLSACDNPQQKFTAYIKHGDALFDQEDFEKARLDYKNAARLQPTAAEPLYRLGLVDEAEGDLHNAFDNFEAAEQQDIHFHPAALKIAEYYMAAEQYEEAHKRVDAALAENPDDAEAHALNAALMLREKHLDAAEREAQAALAKDPNNISATSALTGIYAAKGEPDKAVAAIETGIKRTPRNLALLLLRVMLYGTTNDMPHIAESYQAIFKLKPDQIKFRNDLATLYIKAGKPDDAEAVLREGVAVRPDDWDMKHLLVQFLGDNRSVDVAEKETQTIMQANPSHDEPYFWLADLYIAHDQTDRAIDLLNQIVSQSHTDQSSLNARTMLARIDVKRGNGGLAQKLVDAVLAKKPDNADALYVRANLEFTKGDYQSAVSDLRTITRNNPRNLDALQLLSETLLLQNHLDLAIDTMKQLTVFDPVDLEPQVRLAQMVHLNGDTRQAMDLIAQTTKAAPAYPVGWETAARISIDSREWLPAESAIHTLDQLEGQHLTASFLEGEVLDNNNKTNEAIAHYAEIVSANADTPLAERALAAITDDYQKANRLTDSENYLENVKPQTLYVQTLLAQTKADLGKKAESIALLDKILAENPALPAPYLARAMFYREDKKPDQAIAVLQKAATAAPADFNAPLLEADILAETGKYRQAIALYQDMLARNPGLDIAANNMAEVTADYLADDTAAMEQARQAADRFAGSSNPLLVDTLAWVYFRQGNVPQAQTLMERVMAHDADQLPPQAHYHYGAILAKQGKKAESQAELRKATTNAAPYSGIEDAQKMLNSQ